MSDQKKKSKKKFVGLAAKAKRRKQVSESRLAQRTGMSEERRMIKKLAAWFKKHKDEWEPFKGREKKEKKPEKKPERKFNWGDKKGYKYRDYLLQGNKKGGKVKTYKKGGKA